MPIDSTAATGSSATSTATGRARMAESFDTFLTLLTTQLKNQDPLSPMDSNQFTQQIVQMTGVEQQLLTNDLLEKLVSNTANGVSTAISMIGKQVRALSDDAALVGGKAEWTYDLSAAAADVKIEVLNSKGAVVKVTSATDLSAGDQKFVWDGKDSSGNKLADGGVYTLRVTATSPTGAKVSSLTYINGVVSGVEQDDGKTLITINGTKVPWESVNSISQAPQPATTSQTSLTNSDASDPDEDETSGLAA